MASSISGPVGIDVATLLSLRKWVTRFPAVSPRSSRNGLAQARGIRWASVLLGQKARHECPRHENWASMVKATALEKGALT